MMDAVSPMSWLTSKWLGRVAAIGVVVVGAVLLRRWIYRGSGSGKAAPARPLASSIAPDIAIKQINAWIENDCVTTAGDIVWLLRGENTKQIRLPQAVMDAAESAASSFSSKHKRVWDGVFIRTRWLRAVESRRKTAFNENCVEDTAVLEELWRCVGFAGPFHRRSENWNLLGFQGMDPVTDLRGGGILALEHFLSFAKTQPKELKSMMDFNATQQEDDETSWFLTAVVSIQFTVQLLSERDHPYSRAKLGLVYDGSVEDPIILLHHRLMLHFWKCWQRDRPHVMEYNQYMPKVYTTFFNDE